MLSARAANRRYFTQAYQTGQHGWPVEEPSPYTAGFLKRLKRLTPGGRLLDVGCGEGRHAILAATLGFQVTAIDFEPMALKRARHFAKMKQAGGIIFRKADILRLPFTNSCFDVVLDCGCLHHQRKSDWSAYKTGILQALKPEGFYALSVFSPQFPLFRGSGRPWHIAQGAYRRYFTRVDIVHLFGKDFEIMSLLEQKGRNGGFWHALMKRRSQGE